MLFWTLRVEETVGRCYQLFLFTNCQQICGFLLKASSFSSVLLMLLRCFPESVLVCRYINYKFSKKNSQFMVGMSKVSFSEELISLHIEKTFNFTIYIFTFFSVNVLEQFSNTLTVRSSKVVVNLFSSIVMTPRQICNWQFDIKWTFQMLSDFGYWNCDCTANHHSHWYSDFISSSGYGEMLSVRWRIFFNS